LISQVFFAFRSFQACDYVFFISPLQIIQNKVANLY
jgi:hypothetical protein